MVDLPGIKVCGLTRPEDVRAAVEAGADALGFVRHPSSPRDLDVDTAAALVRAVPTGLVTVAVVVDASPKELGQYLEATGLAWVQLCGDQEPGPWRSFGAPVLRRLGVDEQAEAELDRWDGVATGFVLDHPATPGGGGLPVEIGRAAALSELAPCLLAGGLGPENVRECTLAVRPRGVDASSRLESSPGVKDPATVRDFVRAARAALEDCQ